MTNATASIPALPPAGGAAWIYRRPSALAAVLFAIGAVVGMAVLRLYVLSDRFAPVGYGVPLVAFIWLRDRRVLWGTSIAFACLSGLKAFLGPTAAAPLVDLPLHHRLFDLSIVLLDIAVVASAVHALIGYRDAVERRTADLEAANAELAAREEEVARQNEELQSATEELERQSEELRVGNDELAGRERTMAALLALSRSLTAELSRGQTLARICESLGTLLNAPAHPPAPHPAAGATDPLSAAAPLAIGAARWGSAIVEQEEGRLVVRCHHGFGIGGVDGDVLSIDHSFAALVLGRGKTAYIEDLALRPDLRIPQPKDGPPFASVLAAPLRVGGWPIGTLEVYAHEPTAWGEEQVALVESMAAQASISLEAAHLLETVQQERRRLETVLRATPVGVAVANADGTDVRLNPAGAAMFRVSSDANIALPEVSGGWRRFHDGVPMPEEAHPLARACRGEEVLNYEMEMVLAAGRELVLLVNAAPIRDRGGHVAGAVAAFTDITSQKELQRELALRRREAEEASVRKTRFLAAVSHDIRTPANAISLLAELIRRSASNPAMAAEVPELAQELHGSALSLVNLLSDVLDLARFDSGKVEMQETEFPLGALLAEESRQMQPLAREKELTLHYDLPAQPVWLRTDRIKLSRVLGNLVGNAIKFTESGEVRVSIARTDDGGVRVGVRDTGVGIAPEHLRHIFDEFFQLRNPERDRNKGTGLGLTICRRLVDAMGGRLEVESKPGNGSVFSVTLPASSVAPAPIVG